AGPASLPSAAAPSLGPADPSPPREGPNIARSSLCGAGGAGKRRRAGTEPAEGRIGRRERADPGPDPRSWRGRRRRLNTVPIHVADGGGRPARSPPGSSRARAGRPAAPLGAAAPPGEATTRVTASALVGLGGDGCGAAGTHRSVPARVPGHRR